MDAICSTSDQVRDVDTRGLVEAVGRQEACSTSDEVRVVDTDPTQVLTSNDSQDQVFKYLRTITPEQRSVALDSPFDIPKRRYRNRLGKIKHLQSSILS